MLKEQRKTRLYIIALIAVVLVIAALILIHALGRPKAEPTPAAAPRPTAQVRTRETFIEKLVEVQKEVTVEEIAAGLNDMGVLVTEEYCFTDVVRYNSIKTLFSIELPITETSYLASYDGAVAAGVDFSRIEVRKNDELHTITVSLPRAEVIAVDIDPESFMLYSEKSGLGNPLSAADFNGSLVELERSATEKALSHEVLVRADEHAMQLIRSFVAGLVDPSAYTVRFETL